MSPLPWRRAHPSPFDLYLSTIDALESIRKEVTAMSANTTASALPFTLTDVDGDTLNVSRYSGIRPATSPGGALVNTVSLPGSVGHFVTKEEAPKLALAILLAAGYEDISHGGPIESAVSSLASIEKKKLAAEKLEAEALSLYNAGRRALGNEEVESFEDPRVVGFAETWIQIAKHARRLAAESTK